MFPFFCRSSQEELEAEHEALRFKFADRCLGTDREHGKYYAFTSIAGVYRHQADDTWTVRLRMRRDGSASFDCFALLLPRCLRALRRARVLRYRNLERATHSFLKTLRQAYVEKDAIDALENALNDLGEREKALKAALQAARPHLSSRAPAPPAEDDVPGSGEGWCNNQPLTSNRDEDTTFAERNSDSVRALLRLGNLDESLKNRLIDDIRDFYPKVRHPTHDRLNKTKLHLRTFQAMADLPRLWDTGLLC
jgi:hypothetical protein